LNGFTHQSLEKGEVYMSTTMVVTARQQPFTLEGMFFQVERLTTILEEHKNWKDPLSTKIQTWADDLFTMLLDPNLKINEKVQNGIKRTQELAEKILINPSNNRRFGDPVPHSFAKQMIDWVKDCRSKQEESEEKKPEEDSSPIVNPRTAQISAFVFSNLANMKGVHQRLRACMAVALFEMDIEINRSAKEKDEAVREVNVRAEAQQAKNKADLESVKESMQNQIKMVQAQRAEEAKVHRAETEACLKQMAEQDQSNLAGAKAMNERLTVMEQSYQLRDAKLMQKIDELNQQLGEVKQQYQGALHQVEARAQACEQVVVSQRAELQNRDQRIAKLEDGMLIKEEEAQNLISRMLAVQQRVIAAEARQNDLQRELSRRGNCIIL
jgi:hypothetical protein